MGSSCFLMVWWCFVGGGGVACFPEPPQTPPPVQGEPESVINSDVAELPPPQGKWGCKKAHPTRKAFSPDQVKSSKGFGNHTKTYGCLTFLRKWCPQNASKARKPHSNLWFLPFLEEILPSKSKERLGTLAKIYVFLSQCHHF